MDTIQRNNNKLTKANQGLAKFIEDLKADLATTELTNGVLTDRIIDLEETAKRSSETMRILKATLKTLL